MKKGYILMEVLLALALFCCIGFSFFYLYLQKQISLSDTFRHEKAMEAMQDSLESLYSGELDDKIHFVLQQGYYEDEYTLQNHSFHRSWQHMNRFNPDLCPLIRFTLTWRTGMSLSQHCSMDVYYDP
ncbi:hypothetical protein SDC9_71652 [bioreactor metagenome]|uniref:Uncharacterized protein n=1 Tax=bioreactor metagenome TaxID=1076179 RepID=A0A644Y952_9ZZZZ